MKIPWIEHPRKKEPDTMLTLAVLATLVALGKFIVNGVSVGSVNLGTVDAGLIASILAPTLGAYVARKHSDKKVEE